jgi:CubicO group peptidase (beta-lactamase class C family)
LVGIALQEGKIKSLDEPVGDFLPEFKEGDKAKVTIRNLMTMTSGTNWQESYASPISMTTEAYYGSDLYKLATSVKVVKTPGSQWRYKSGDSQLLGLILEKASGKSLSEYASEKLWKPMGAVHPALWSTDKKAGNEKAYCCFNTNARDFSRLGTLYLHDGNWHGKQLIDTALVKLFTTPLNIKDDEDSLVNYYGYMWWVLPERTGVFYARGILGQYIIVIPKKKMVLVRLGEKRGEPMHQSYVEVYAMVDWALKNF